MWHEEEAVGRQFNLSGSYSVWLKFWAQKSPPGIQATLIGCRTLSWNDRASLKTSYHPFFLKANCLLCCSPEARTGFVTSLASAGDGGFRNVSFEPGVHHHGGLTFLPTHLLHLPSSRDVGESFTDCFTGLPEGVQTPSEEGGRSRWTIWSKKSSMGVG